MDADTPEAGTDSLVEDKNVHRLLVGLLQELLKEQSANE